MVIKHLGKQFRTDTKFDILTDEEYENIIELWKQKPTKEEVLYEMSGVRQGLVNISAITRYYFKDLMEKVVCHREKYSIEEMLQSKELVSFFVGKTKNNDKVFCGDRIKDIETAIRLGGSGVCRKATQFPMKVAKYILEKYNTNNNWYDFSCGWGCRLLPSLQKKINYYGTDPNYLLCEKLEELKNDYKSTQLRNENIETVIKCCGSETFIKEWVGKMGLAFSSPPYFNLEDYKIGNQSYTKGTTYQNWLENYMLPTFMNISNYLTDDGFFIVNIKDYAGYPLEEDTKKCAEMCGFYLYDVEKLSNNKRNSSIGGGEFMVVDNDENIYVFAKKGHTPKCNEQEQLSFF